MNFSAQYLSLNAENLKCHEQIMQQGIVQGMTDSNKRQATVIDVFLTKKAEIFNYDIFL